MIKFLFLCYKIITLSSYSFHCRSNKECSTNLLFSLKFYPRIIISAWIFKKSNIMKSISVFNLNFISHYLDRVLSACFSLYLTTLIGWWSIIILIICIITNCSSPIRSRICPVSSPNICKIC